MIISSFFTTGGIPNPGLSPLPTIDIYSVNGATSTPVLLGTPLVEASEGFYQYQFSTYDPNLDYVFLVDGGSSYAVNDPERYQPGSIEVATVEASTVIDIGASAAQQVLDAQTTDHQLAGSVGLAISQTKVDTTNIAANLYVNANSVLDLVNIVLQYDTNRTKIDPTAKTLTVYQDDCVTPLRVFQLIDTTGAPSITEVAERKPISATDGLPVCI